MERITSKTNPLLTHIRKLGTSRSYRREQREFLCDGGKLLEEAAAWGAEITALLTAEPAIPSVPEGVRAVCLPRELFRSLSPLQNPQSVLFTCRIPEEPGECDPDSEKYVVLEGIQDPGNLGTILRTADAFGIGRVILLPGCADAYNPKTVRATMGAIFRQRVSEMDLPEMESFLKKREIPLYAAVLDPDAADLREIDLGRAAAAVGSEGTGISPELRALCRGGVRIPMRSRCESLNAAAAAAVLMWEMCKDAL